MANTKITSLTDIAATPASNDVFPLVDVSDTTQASTGTTKYITANRFVFQDGGTVSFMNSNHLQRGTFICGDSTFDIDPRPPSGTVDSNFRFYRFTNTTGSKAVIFYKGDNTSTAIHQIGMNTITRFNAQGDDLDFNIRGDTDTTLFYLDASTDRIGIGTSTPASKLDVVGTVQMDALRIDQTPTAGTFTNTHYITVNLNGTTYRIPCAV